MAEQMLLHHYNLQLSRTHRYLFDANEPRVVIDPTRGKPFAYRLEVKITPLEAAHGRAEQPAMIDAWTALLDAGFDLLRIAFELRYPRSQTAKLVHIN
jgi:hypothetical protein